MTGLSKFLTWRMARWAVLAAAVPAVWACSARPLAKPEPKPARTFNGLFQQALNRDIDIVFMVDNSKSMQPLQQKLATNFPAFMQVLTDLPGGLPNVHIAVVSSDMGAGPYSEQDIPACRPGGDQGAFRATQQDPATCAMGSLNAGQTFIIGSNTPGTANYTGNISSAFSCLAQLGDNGCGFEHQFASVLRALGADGQPLPPSNANFLRANAYLAIVLITNEDDCSAPANSTLFDPGSRFVSDQLGPLASYRCNEFGHLCGGARPPRTPIGGTQDLSGTCKSAEDGVLLKVSDVVTKIKALKADPNKILVAAIAGPPTPYVVEQGPPALPDDPNLWPQVRHSCTQKGPTANSPDEYADPAIRIKEWVDSFGANGVFQVICNNTLTMALQVIATKLGTLIGNPCVEGKVLDTQGQPWTAGDANPPDCTVVDHTYNDQGVKIDTPVVSCASNNNTPPCWALDAGGGKCAANQFIMNFNRPPGPPATDLNSTVSCNVRVCPPPGTPGKPDDCP